MCVVLLNTCLKPISHHPLVHVQCCKGEVNTFRCIAPSPATSRQAKRLSPPSVTKSKSAWNLCVLRDCLWHVRERRGVREGGGERGKGGGGDERNTKRSRDHTRVFPYFLVFSQLERKPSLGPEGFNILLLWRESLHRTGRLPFMSNYSDCFSRGYSTPHLFNALQHTHSLSCLLYTSDAADDC